LGPFINGFWLNMAIVLLTLPTFAASKLLPFVSGVQYPGCFNLWSLVEALWIRRVDVVVRSAGYN